MNIDFKINKIFYFYHRIYLNHWFYPLHFMTFLKEETIFGHSKKKPFSDIQYYNCEITQFRNCNIYGCSIRKDSNEIELSS